MISTNRQTRQRADNVRQNPTFVRTIPRRSEEHTSELQSQSNLVCRLLLEKKKTLDSEHIERFPDIAWRPFLARMGAEKKYRLAFAAQHLLELRRRVSELRWNETQPPDFVR